jgi:predicted N-acyltransferase
MDGLRIEVVESIEAIDSDAWARLEGGCSLYQGHAWLAWAEESCGAQVRYLTAHDRAGALVGALPAYLLTGTDTTWNSWYDPLTVLAGDPAGARLHHSTWFPLLLLGGVSGYHSDVLVSPTLGEIDRRAVIRELVRGGRLLAAACGAHSTAMMYAPETTAVTVASLMPGASTPVLTSASTRIRATWRDFDHYLASFPSRRRCNLRREVDLFGATGHRVVQARLSDCVEFIGPLLGNVHRRHGAADSDEDTLSYLASQVPHLDPVSTVFLELDDDGPVGFSLCMEWGGDLVVRVVGFDYERSARFAYFTLAYYRPLEYAIGRGLGGVELGPGTYQAKVARGATLQPTWSVVWPPDEDEASWFERARRPGPDAEEAAPWLPGNLFAR